MIALFESDASAETPFILASNCGLPRRRPCRGTDPILGLVLLLNGDVEIRAIRTPFSDLFPRPPSSQPRQAAASPAAGRRPSPPRSGQPPRPRVMSARIDCSSKPSLSWAARPRFLRAFIFTAGVNIGERMSL